MVYHYFKFNNFWHEYCYVKVYIQILLNICEFYCKYIYNVYKGPDYELSY